MSWNKAAYMLRNLVGNGRSNYENDVFGIKNNLKRLGRYTGPVSNGIIDRPMVDGITHTSVTGACVLMAGCARGGRQRPQWRGS